MDINWPFVIPLFAVALFVLVVGLLLSHKKAAGYPVIAGEFGGVYDPRYISYLAGEVRVEGENASLTPELAKLYLQYFGISWGGKFLKIPKSMVVLPFENGYAYVLYEGQYRVGWFMHNTFQRFIISRWAVINARILLP